MQDNTAADASNGYEKFAEEFRSRRSRTIGVATVREWARELPRAGAVLDLGCGDGTPITQVLVEAGLVVYGVDASPSMIRALHARLPAVVSECASVTTSTLFGRHFDGAIAWGLLFLLTAEEQAALIQNVARALVSGGRFAFTAPRQRCEWKDTLTGQTSTSVGSEAYRRLLGDAGLRLVGEADDEGHNHYYFAVRP